MVSHNEMIWKSYLPMKTKMAIEKKIFREIILDVQLNLNTDAARDVSLLFAN